MDPQPIPVVPQPIITIHKKTIKIQQQYVLTDTNKNKQNIPISYLPIFTIIKQKIIQQQKKSESNTISTNTSIPTDNNIINGIQWKWANNLTQANILQLIHLLSPQFLKFYLSGSSNITVQCLDNLLLKCKQIEQINLYYKGQYYHQKQVSQCQLGENFIGWDLNWHINIQNSMKNYRQSQKWCNLISSSTNKAEGKIKLYKILTKLPSSIKILGLRNISLGKIQQCFKIILQSCPHLSVLDLGQTQLTDDNILIVPQGILVNFRENIISFKIDCNRITYKTLQKIFPEHFVRDKQSKNKKQPLKLQILDISRTNIVNVYRSLYKNLSQLRYLGLSYLQISDQEVLQTYENKQINKQQYLLKQLVLQYVCLSVQAIQAIIDGYPQLQSLTLSNIQINQKYITQTLIQGKTRHNIKLYSYVLLPKQSKIKRLNISYNKYITENEQCIPNLLANTHNLQVLKISGTKICSRQLLSLCQYGSSIQWLQISYLEQLGFELMDKQSVENVYNSGHRLLNQLLAHMPKLYYIQAYGLLNNKQIKQFLEQNKEKIFKKSSVFSYNCLQKENILIVVLDTNGPIYLRKQAIK